MNVLVNAGGGYVGQVLVKTLLKNGFKVTVVDRFFYKDKSSLPKNKNLKIIKDDVRKINIKLFKLNNIVIDLTNVSIAPVGDKFYDKLTWEIDYLTRKRNIKLAKKYGVNKYIYPSTCSVYGFSKSYRLLDEKSKLDPKSMYAKAQSKLESFALNQGDEKFCISILRLPTVFGLSPRTRFDVIINALVFDVLEKKRINLLRDGKQRRPFVHVKDVANAFIFFIKTDSNKINNQIFNVGDEINNINLLSLSKLIFKVTQIKENIVWYGKSDDRSYYVSFNKIKKLGFKAKYDIKFGIKELTKAYKKRTLIRTEDSINIKWLNKLESNKRKFLNKSSLISNSLKKILSNRYMYGGFLNILESKKILIFIGANRESETNVAISCLEFLQINFFFDQYDVVVTDNNKELIDYLKNNKINFFKKEQINNIFNNTIKNYYDWFLNIWGHTVYPKYFLAKIKNNLNIHPSYLPYGKGKDSSLWTIVKNYPAGSSLHKMTYKLDGGPIFVQKKFDYYFPTTGNDIYQKSLNYSIDLFVNNWSKIREQKIKPKNQKINKLKTYLRSEMIRDNHVDLNDKKNKKIREFIMKSLAHDFGDNFNIKIKLDNKLYNYRSLIKIKKQ